MNGNMYTLGQSIQEGDVSMNSKLTVDGDVSLKSNLYIGKDVVIHGRLSVQEYQQNNVVYTNVALLVSEDISLNGNLTVLKDASLNENLFVGGDVTLNNRLNVGGDMSLNGNFYAKDIIVDNEGFILFTFSPYSI
jgi:predicted acyltransferase (DUF342 family)